MRTEVQKTRSRCWGMAVVLWAAACSDYQIDKVEGVEAPGTAPEIAVDPGVVAPGVTCGPHPAELTVANVGDGVLTVTDLILTGEGWALISAPALPFSIDPGAAEQLLVEGQGGPATLALRSDDPTRSQVTVQLESQPDVAPELSLDPPPDAGALGPGAQLDLPGELSDGAADPTTLAVTWTSDVDGELGTVTPDATGAFALPWDGLLRTPGPHLLTATLVDACGNTVSDTIVVCQEAGYVADDLALDTWHYEGTAAWDAGAGAVELTALDPFAVGTAFQTAQAVAGDRLSIAFEFETGGGTGADGFSVTALDADRMTGFMGAPGCALGYGEPHESCIDEGEALPGWSIEVDTYYNPYIDPSSSDHLSLTFDGDLDTTAAWSDLPEVEDTGWHLLEVDVRAPWVQVRLDGETLVDQEVAGWTEFPAYIGFTAATGADTNAHTIRGLTVTGDACDGFVPVLPSPP